MVSNRNPDTLTTRLVKGSDLRCDRRFVVNVSVRTYLTVLTTLSLTRIADSISILCWSILILVLLTGDARALVLKEKELLIHLAKVRHHHKIPCSFFVPMLPIFRSPTMHNALQAIVLANMAQKLAR